MSKKNWTKEQKELWKQINKIKSPSGYILKKDLIENNIKLEDVDFFVGQNELLEEHFGYFIGWENPDYQAYIQSQIPTSIFCLETALIFHKMSDRFFDEIFVAVNQPTSIKKYRKQFKKLWMVVYYKDKQKYELGITRVKTENNKYVYVYDVERTICDILKYRKKMDTEVFREAVREYFQNANNSSISKILKYAKILGVEEKVRLCMEVL